MNQPAEQTQAPLATQPFGASTAITYPSRRVMANAASDDVGVALRDCLAKKQVARVVLAAAPSQAEMLAELAIFQDIDWSRVTLFHMDEFIGLSPDARQRFAAWLDAHFFSKVPQATALRIVPEPDPEAEAKRYASLLKEDEIDLVCLGIGVNGHIAFNDPPVADFDDPLDVKVVELDRTCRLQQVDDQGFRTIDEVPTHAVTLTVPRLLRAKRLFCCVPGSHKVEAVRNSLDGPITTEWPASILRTHPDCTLYLDKDSNPDV
ncbi:MAG: glucosamine-6-phosphate deaminase [Pseudomonadota bacterium]